MKKSIKKYVLYYILGTYSILSFIYLIDTFKITQGNIDLSAIGGTILLLGCFCLVFKADFGIFGFMKKKWNWRNGLK
jgi:hypothetical protein